MKVVQFKILILIFFFFYNSSIYGQLIPKLSENGKWGYKKGESKKFKIEPLFDEAYPFYNELARVKTEQGFQLINEKGELLLRNSFDFIGWQNEDLNQKKTTPFINNYIGIKKNNEWGLINSDLKEIFTPKFETIKLLKDKIFTAKLGKWGIYNLDGKEVYPHVLDSVITKNTTFIVWQNNAIGLINENGNTLEDFIYKSFNKEVEELISYKQFELFNATTEDSYSVYADSIAKVDSTLTWVKRSNKWALASIEQKKLLIPFILDSFKPFEEGYSKVKMKGKYGLINQKGQFILPCEYYKININSKSLIRAQKNENSSWQFYDSKGIKIALKLFPDWVSNNFENNLYLAKKNNKYGYVDESLKIVIPYQYNFASDYQHRFAVVKKDDYSGVIDAKGNWVISPVVDSLKILSAHAFIFHDREIWGTLDTNGVERFIANSNISYEILEEGLIIKKGEKQGYVNKYGSIILEPIYDNIQVFDENYLQVEQNGLVLYASKYSDEVPNLETCNMWLFNAQLAEDFIAVNYQNQSGFIDYLCRLRISVRYEGVKSFSEGLAAVKLSGSWGYINKEERLIIQPRYQSASTFKNGYAVVEEKGLHGLIDKYGKVVLPLEYDAIALTENQNWLLIQGENMGIISRNLQNIIFPKYDKIQDNSTQTVIVEREKKFGIDNMSGVHIRFTEYDNIEHWQGNFYLFKKPSQVSSLK